MGGDYSEFLASKRRAVQQVGFEVSIDEILDVIPKLWLWQAYVVQWALKTGRSAIFADCGLGKTLMQLAWSYFVHKHTGKPVLILCPWAVAQQTLAEAVRFGIPCPAVVAESEFDIASDCGTAITNYQKLHLFNASYFGGVVLDESSILKNYTGATKQLLVETFRFMKFKLCCTATAAPNDLLELGNHAEFLGVMPSNEMIARWFINDSMKCGHYRLRRHGEEDFWRWVSSWAICISRPSDLGEQFSDEGYILPELRVIEHVVADENEGSMSSWSSSSSVSATNHHAEKRASLKERCETAAKLAKSNNEHWALWCTTDYEADFLLKCLGVKGDGLDDFGGIVEVRGSHSAKVKEERLKSFGPGRSRVIITKPDIGGYGMNWQHCHNTACFASFSYEDWYQLVRRFLRFGQLSPFVACHMIFSENERSVVKTMKEKEDGHRNMKLGMADRMREFTRSQLYERPPLSRYTPTVAVPAPKWLVTH